MEDRSVISRAIITTFEKAQKLLYIYIYGYAARAIARRAAQKYHRGESQLDRKRVTSPRRAQARHLVPILPSEGNVLFPFVVTRCSEDDFLYDVFFRFHLRALLPRHTRRVVFPRGLVRVANRTTVTERHIAATDHSTVHSILNCVTLGKERKTARSQVDVSENKKLVALAHSQREFYDNISIFGRNIPVLTLNLRFKGLTRCQFA